jgi:hypothetical protein
VGGKFVGLTPFRLTGIESSKIKVAVRKEGFESVEQTIDLREVGKMKRITLKPLSYIEIKTDKPESRLPYPMKYRKEFKLWVDNEEVSVPGHGIVIVQAEEGIHTIRVQTECGEREAKVRATPEYKEIVELKTFGEIFVTSKPPSALVEIRREGEDVGEQAKVNSISPMKALLCGGNSFLISASKEHFHPDQKIVKLERGGVQQVYFELEPKIEDVEYFRAKRKKSRIVFWTGAGIGIGGIGLMAYSQTGAKANPNISKSLMVAGAATLGAGMVTTLISIIIQPDVPEDLEEYL